MYFILTFLAFAIAMIGTLPFLDRLYARSFSGFERRVWNLPADSHRVQRLHVLIKAMPRGTTVIALLIGVVLGTVFALVQDSSEYTAVAIISWAIFLLVALGLHHTNSGHRVILKSISNILDTCMEQGNEGLLQDLLEALVRDKNRKNELLAVRIHLEWGSARSWAQIQHLKLRFKSNYGKRSEALLERINRKENAYRIAHKSFRRNNPILLDMLLDKSRFWRVAAQASNHTDPALLNQLFPASKQQAHSTERWLRQHQELFDSFPDLYCEDCFRFAEKVRFSDFEMVRCPDCKSTDALHAGIHTVIGQIGDAQHLELVGNKLYVALWKADEKRAFPAEVSKVEVKTQAGIDYNWALAAVTESLSNHSSGEAGKIPLEMDASIELDNNTRQIVEHFYARLTTIASNS